MEVKSTESSTTSSDQKTKTDIVAIEGINSKNRVVNVEESIGNSKRTVKAISIGVKEQESLIVKSRNQGSSDDSQLPYEIIVVNSESGNGILTENDLDQATTKKPIDVTDNFIAVNDTSNLAAGQKEVFTDSIVSEEVKEILQKKKKLSASIVSIKLAVAPDFSSIKYFTPGKPGLAYGVLVGYSLSNRWSVYTGALSSRKIYSSNNIDKPYTTSGGYPYAVNKLEGDCRVLDIPINFYYTIFPERSFSLKAGIGISSYLMLSEDYVYHVDNPYGPDEYSQNIDRKNNEWFRVMNISLTIQKRLSNQFSIELEPFLKAPLTGVGEGEVSLVSLGAFFNLRFDIPITKSN